MKNNLQSYLKLTANFEQNAEVELEKTGVKWYTLETTESSDGTREAAKVISKGINIVRGSGSIKTQVRHRIPLRKYLLQTNIEHKGSNKN